MVLLALAAIEHVVMVVVLTMEKNYHFLRWTNYCLVYFSNCFICQSPSFKKWMTSIPMPLLVFRLWKTNKEIPDIKKHDNLVKTIKAFAWIMEHVFWSNCNHSSTRCLWSAEGEECCPAKMPTIANHLHPPLTEVPATILKIPRTMSCHHYPIKYYEMFLLIVGLSDTPT